MKPRGRRVDNPGPVHYEIARWLRANAFGRRRAVVRTFLVEHIREWSTRSGLYRDVRDANDFDREVRAWVKETLVLGWPVVSCAKGYFYADINDPVDRRVFRHGILSRVTALLRVYRAGGHAWEAEAQRIDAGRPARQLPLPAPVPAAYPRFGQQVMFERGTT